MLDSLVPSVIFCLFYSSLRVSYASKILTNVNINDEAEPECISPYRPIGGNCLFIDNRIEGTWEQMKTFCQEINGDLAFFNDANVLYDVVFYINENGLNDSSFWIGADDLLSEGNWVWSWDNHPVRMHTPLWGTRLFSQEPTGGLAQNCGMLNMEKFYYMFDEDCNALHGVICDPLDNKGTKTGKDSQEIENKVDNSTDCPVPFESFGNSCLLIDSIKSNTWHEGRLLCQGLGGHLAKVEDANILGDLFDKFADEGININMWIGGSDGSHEGDWKWLDESSVKKGTPFWGETILGKQEPSGGVQENCLGLSHQHFFFFSDLSCSELGGVICQYDI